MSPALAGGFLTTAPPGKALSTVLNASIIQWKVPRLEKMNMIWLVGLGDKVVLGPNSVERICQNEENRKIPQFTGHSAELSRLQIEFLEFLFRGQKPRTLIATYSWR